MSSYRPYLPKATHAPWGLGLQMKDDSFVTAASYLAGTFDMDYDDLIGAEVILTPVSVLTKGAHTLHIFRDRSALLLHNDSPLRLPLRLPGRVNEKTLPWHKAHGHWASGDTLVTPKDIETDLWTSAEFWMDYAAALPKPWDGTTSREEGFENRRIFPWTHLPLSQAGCTALVKAAMMTGALMTHYNIPITNGLGIEAWYVDWSGTIAPVHPSETTTRWLLELWEHECPPTDRFVTRPRANNAEITNRGTLLYCAPKDIKAQGSAHDQITFLAKALEIVRPL